jgi:hypothetical protein
MKKKLLFAAAAFLILIAAVAVYFYNNIDSIVKNAVERSGTDITGTKVSVGSVDISLSSGKGTIRNVRVANPDGFADMVAVSLGELTLDLDVGSLNRDPIIIESIHVKGPLVNAEVDEKLATNVGTIRDHVQQYQVSDAKPAADKQDAGYGKHFVIRSFVVEEGLVKGDATRVRPGEKREFALPPIELSDVGGSRGARPEALGKVISAALFARIQHEVSEKMKEAAAERVKTEVENKVKDILNR